MTPEDVKKIITAAGDMADLQRWDDLLELLRPLDESGELTGEAAGDAAYYFGLACQAQGAPDAAASYFEVSAQQGSGLTKSLAKGALDELARAAEATGAIADGVTKTDAAAVLAAADDALSRDDPDTAMGFYRQVYDGTVEDEARFEAALGIASVYARQTSYDDAEDYANYVKAQGSTKLRTQAADLLTWIAGLRAAAAAVGDGVAADEFTSVIAAAGGLYIAGNYAAAVELYRGVYESEHAPAPSRYQSAWMAAACHISLDDDASARPLLDDAIAHLSGEEKTNAEQLLALLDDLEAAKRLAQQLRPSTDES